MHTHCWLQPSVNSTQLPLTVSIWDSCWSFESKTDATISSSCLRDTDRNILQEKPHQPRVFLFPKWECGKKSAVRRSFHMALFDKWLWIHRCEENDSTRAEGKGGEEAVMLQMLMQCLQIRALQTGKMLLLDFLDIKHQVVTKKCSWKL